MVEKLADQMETTKVDWWDMMMVSQRDGVKAWLRGRRQDELKVWATGETKDWKTGASRGEKLVTSKGVMKAASMGDWKAVMWERYWVVK